MKCDDRPPRLGARSPNLASPEQKLLPNAQAREQEYICRLYLTHRHMREVVMRKNRSFDALVKARLREWPQHPPGLLPRPNHQETWLRGRPTYDVGGCHPFLKLPGSDRLRTLPDGLWLNFAGSPEEPFVDIFGIM
jgi:hypothetical protein